jgi:hypothetical protein
MGYLFLTIVWQLYYNIKLTIMDPQTLIKVVAMIDARIARLLEIPSPSDMVKISELEALSEHIQKAIDADVAAMETSQGM